MTTKLHLTDREQQIADLLLRDQSEKQMADALGISLSGVRRHLERLRAKFNCHSRLGLALAIQAHLGDLALAEQPWPVGHRDGQERTAKIQP
ncbi:MAG: response regulator transcription factor [Verrucomicrobiota bacterium]